MQLEVDSWKLQSEKTKATNADLKATLDTILDEKLTTDLKNQSLMRHFSKNEDGNSSLCRREHASTLQAVIEETIKFFTQFEEAINQA